MINVPTAYHWSTALMSVHLLCHSHRDRSRYLPEHRFSFRERVRFVPRTGGSFNFTFRKGLNELVVFQNSFCPATYAKPGIQIGPLDFAGNSGRWIISVLGWDRWHNSLKYLIVVTGLIRQRNKIYSETYALPSVYGDKASAPWLL